MKPKKPPAAAEAELKNLPNVRKMHVWTKEIDHLILTYAPVKGVRAVSAVLGIPYSAVERRFVFLKAGKK